VGGELVIKVIHRKREGGLEKLPGYITQRKIEITVLTLSIFKIDVRAVSNPLEIVHILLTIG
jgi:hypothetical protein